MTKVGQVLPRPVQGGIVRAFRADVLSAADPAARAAYEQRVRGLAVVPDESVAE
jgi:hypothetical protein